MVALEIKPFESSIIELLFIIIITFFFLVKVMSIVLAGFIEGSEPVRELGPRVLSHLVWGI